jgi:hypothetical protein
MLTDPLGEEDPKFYENTKNTQDIVVGATV